MGNCSSETRISPSENLPSSTSVRNSSGISANTELAWAPESFDGKQSEPNMETKTQELTVVQGYLWTREGIFRVLTRRWYFLHNGQIRVKRNQRSTGSAVLPLCDLRLCRVACLPDRRSISITPPVPPGLVFQAANERHATMWKDKLTEYISRGLAQRGLQTMPNAVINLIRVNPTCADCRAPNPEWVSLNIGVLICTQCAAVHRSLGSHISKVRSLVEHQSSFSPGIFALLDKLDNNCVNQVWEGWIGDIRSNNNYSGRQERERWIRNKYVYRFFLKNSVLLHEKDPGLRLYEAAFTGDLLGMVRAFAAGANTKWIDEEGNNALHVATALGSIPCVQFLICNDSDIWATNNNGETAADVAVTDSAVHQMLIHQQSLVAPRSLLPAVDSNAKDRAFASIETVTPPRQYPHDDDANKDSDSAEMFEESVASDEMQQLEKQTGPLGASSVDKS